MKSQPDPDTISKLDRDILTEGAAVIDDPSDPTQPEATPGIGVRSEVDWMDMARSAYTESVDWMDASVSKTWQTSLAHFQNRHAPDSKYHGDGYKRRAHMFRPKTRASVRSHEAALAAALFANTDLISMEAENKNDPAGASNALFRRALMEYHLNKSIPWFQTVIGAYQDTLVYGVCFSYEYWDYEKVTYSIPVEVEGQLVYDEEGNVIEKEMSEVTVDRPCIDLVPPENLLFSATADWRDPIQSSPIVIRIVPMPLSEALEMAERNGWYDLDAGTYLAAMSADKNATKRERNQGRQDPDDAQISAHATVYLHENFVRHEGEEYVFWSVGTTAQLSDAVPLASVYFHGRRPITMGVSVIETHRTHPDSPTALAAGLQVGTNEVTNQRSDNVALALNKRYALRRGAQIDTESLMRNVPGGGIMTDDPDRDIRVLETPDVTQSAYLEQDRFDVQFDEIFGTFSGSSVQSNRNMNETVGGMQLLQAGASAVSEYTIRTFVETWVEPVLRKLDLLVCAYETDQTVMAIAGAEIPGFGESAEADKALLTHMTVRLNVGIGATNPQQKVERMMFGINAIAQLPGAAERINTDEVAKEVFGALGYKDGTRFLAEMQAQPDPGPPPEMQIEQARNELERERMAAKREMDQYKADKEYEVKLAELALRENLTLEELRVKLQIEQGRREDNQMLAAVKDKTARDAVAAREGNKMQEMELKRRTGSGI